MIFSETNAKIAPALVKSWSELETPKHNTSVKVTMKSGGTYKFEYTDLNGILNEARRVFKDNGISIIQNSFTEISDGAKFASIETMLLHTSGEYVKSEKLRFPAAASMQDFGGQLTYMKRYSLSAMLGIATEKDDDANGASGNQYDYNPKNQQQSKSAESNLITAEQMSTLVAKVATVATANQQDKAAVFQSAAAHFKLKKTANQLTKDEAAKIIDYLATLEG